TPINSALPALQDEGALTEDAIAFLGQFGVRSRDVVHTRDGRNSDVEASAVNDEPTLGSLQRSASTLFVGPYAIDPGADDAELLVKAALASHIPVRVDALVDSVFGDWKPSKPAVPAPNQLDPTAGGHAMYIIGYTPNGYIVRNSWGTSWGDRGDCIVSPDWLRTVWGLYPWVVSSGGAS
ncbi:MAG: hypothetical protein FWD73_16615, partial [Polyangiaceae bacterium]|nr:hypothetical protein [Polyangiaceae bacterium]